MCPLHRATGTQEGQGPPQVAGVPAGLTLPCPCPLGWRPWLSMVAAYGLGFLVWCRAHPEEPASLGTHGPARDSVIYLPRPGHLMGDTR